MEQTNNTEDVLWLAENILETLYNVKIHSWLCQVRLSNDTMKLRIEVEKIKTMFTTMNVSMKGKIHRRPLGRLMELLYEADEVVDDLGYYMLKYQVEPVELEGSDEKEQIVVSEDIVASSASGSARSSEVWNNYAIVEYIGKRPSKAMCLHCKTKLQCLSSGGTTSMRNHLQTNKCKSKRSEVAQTSNRSSGDVLGSRKRRRSDEISTRHTGANTPPWNKEEFCYKMQEVTCQLQEAISEVQVSIVSMPSLPIFQDISLDKIRRTSGILQSKMYGRVSEKSSIIKMATRDEPDSLLVIPIVGMGGVGKTVLAQNIYNDPVMKAKYSLRIWVWVSSNFDGIRVTKEILDYVSPQSNAGIVSPAKLEELLADQIRSKRFLLVLDDIWSNLDDHNWQKLLALMHLDNAKGSTIIITTRNLSVAKRIGTVDAIKLNALLNEDFLPLFKRCVFGDDSYNLHPGLNIIAQKIVKKLHGNPLAAETVGMLLKENLSISHWNNILDNEIWKSWRLERGIMASLKLSYDCLNEHEKRCFRYLSLFPKGYVMRRNELVRAWVSQGFVHRNHTGEKLEHIGRIYLDALVDNGFFEQLYSSKVENYIVMLPLMHDFALFLSKPEFGNINGSKSNAIGPITRHLSVTSQYDSLFSHENFVKKLQEITSVEKLRSLVVLDFYSQHILQDCHDILNGAENLRLLHICAPHSDIVSFMSKFSKYKHLRYLRLKAMRTIEETSTHRGDINA